MRKLNLKLSILHLKQTIRCGQKHKNTHEDMIDHRSYTHNTYAAVKLKPERNSQFQALISQLLKLCV